jgi:hypothetical protein
MRAYPDVVALVRWRAVVCLTLMSLPW